MIAKAALCCLFATSMALFGGLNFEQVRKAKAATVLIEIKRDKAYGSGFCFDTDSRLVITNHHVVEKAGKQLRVVIHPGEEGQEIVPVEVLRSDKELDLALLRLAPPKAPLASLPLGATDKLFETMELIAFGYPFGKSLAVDDNSYPTVSVNVGKVTSLRRATSGSLSGIQMDALVNPGNSGGPVLDDDGRVVGVTASGIPGSGVNFAIPVDHVRRFITRPELEVAAPGTVPWGKRYEAVTLRMKMTTYTRLTGTVVCHATLDDVPTPRQMLVDESTPGQEWTATASLLVPPPEDDPVQVRIEMGDTILITRIPGRPLRIGDQEWPLREIAQIKPNATVKLQNGRTLQEPVSGLAPLVVQFADQDVTIPVDAVQSLSVLDKQKLVPSVPYAVWLSIDGTEVARQTGTVKLMSPARSPHGWGNLSSYSANTPPEPVQPVPQTRRSTPAPLPPPETGAAAPTDEQTDEPATVTLPARFTDCVRAAGGRVLLLPMPTLKRIAVFDLATQDTLGYAPMPSADALIAGGRRYFFIADPKAGLLDRWALEPLKRDRRVNLPMTGRIYSMAMGAASDGPLLIIHSEGGSIRREFIDGEQLSRLVLDQGSSNRYHPQHPPTIRAADCGTVFGAWTRGLSPSELEVYSILDGELRTAREHKSVGHVVPGPLGERIYTGSVGPCMANLSAAPNRPVGARCCLPSSHPAYYLGIGSSGARYMRGGRDLRLGIYTRDLSIPILNLPPNSDVAAVNVVSSKSGLDFDKHYHLVPQLHLLAIIPSSCDRVLIYPVDIEKSLRERGIDFLFVDSIAPAFATRGKAFLYRLDVRTSAESVSYSLDAGPPGMAVSPAGEVTWEVPEHAEPPGGIIVGIKTNDGQSLYHTFQLRLAP